MMNKVLSEMSKSSSMRSKYDSPCDSTIQSFRQSIRNFSDLQLLRLLELYAWQASLINMVYQL